MSSATPRRKTPPRNPKLGEEIWRIYVNHVFWSCELRDHDEYGIEAQILRDGELVIGHRFDTRSIAKPPALVRAYSSYNKCFAVGVPAIEKA